MTIIIYISIAVAILGVVACGIAVWALVSKRYKNYADILHEHKEQLGRVTKKLSKEVE